MSEILTLGDYLAMQDFRKSLFDISFKISLEGLEEGQIVWQKAGEWYFFWANDGQVPTVDLSEELTGETDEDLDDEFRKIVRAPPFAGAGWATFLLVAEKKDYVNFLSDAIVEDVEDDYPSFFFLSWEGDEDECLFHINPRDEEEREAAEELTEKLESRIFDLF